MSDLTADNGEQDHEKYSTVGSYVREGEEYDRDTTYIEDRIVADPEHAQLSPGAQAWPWSPGGTAWSRPGPAPGRTAR